MTKSGRYGIIRKIKIFDNEVFDYEICIERHYCRRTFLHHQSGENGKNTKFEIKPQFSRTIRRVQENDKLYFVSLEVKVESTETEPKPFNLKARLVGIFEAEDVKTDEDRQVLAISTTEIVYPYLRSAVSALTANAFINPLILPVIPAGTMFPEDRGEKNATLSFENPDMLN